MALTWGELVQLLGSELSPLLDCCLRTGVAVCFSRFSALTSAFGLCCLLSAYSFVWAMVCDNYSKVDQLWSILPAVYAWLFYAHHDAYHSRGLLVCILISLWSLRLTYNFWLKGGYGGFVRHEEDYRWPVLRRLIGSPALFFLFNLTFIASYQNLLLLLIALPVYGVTRGPSEVGPVDGLLTVTFLLFLCLETAADHQHWLFQSKKLSLSPADRARHPDPDIRDGFYQSGLFRYTRHPNYFAEQGMWACVCLFSTTRASLSELLSPLSMGSVLLILLFQGSMAFGESISSSKYSSYRDYQRRTSQCVPWPPGPRSKIE